MRPATWCSSTSIPSPATHKAASDPFSWFRIADTIPGLFLGVPLTSTDRRLPHHVRIASGAHTGLHRTSYAMTEQLRALSLGRINQHLGNVDSATFGRVSRYLHLFIG